MKHSIEASGIGCLIFIIMAGLALYGLINLIGAIF